MLSVFLFLSSPREGRPLLYILMKKTSTLRPSTKWALALAILNLIFYIGLTIPLFGNIWATAMWLPFALTLAYMLPLLLTVIRIRKATGKVGVFLDYLLSTLAVLLAVGYFAFFLFVLSKLTYVIFNAKPIYVTAVMLIFLGYFLFAYPHQSKGKKFFGGFMATLLCVCYCTIVVFGVFPFYFTSDGTVFAVEDEYQIAWSTSTASIGQLTVGDKTYYDAQNGENQVSKLHKVCIPASELDEVKEYTITSTPVYFHMGYASLTGEAHSKNFTFRPVDMTDGLQAYVISDNHEVLVPAIKAGSYWGDDLDLLILNGDNINDLSSEWQISLIYRLASGVTHGTRPVIFVRGNHECNGKYAPRLADYVASYEGNLYYKVAFGQGENRASFLVLDTANDMADDHFLLKPLANYTPLQQREVAWLTAQNGWNDGAYNVVLAHCAFALNGYNRFPEWTQQLVTLIDGKADMMMAGHSHRLDVAMPMDSLYEGAKTSFPVIRGGMRAESICEVESVLPTVYSGTAILAKDGHLTTYFTNQKNQILKATNVK